MTTRRVRWAVGVLCLMATGIAASGWAMESEYRLHEPAGMHNHPAPPVPGVGVTRSPRPLEDSRRPTGPAFRTGDGSHPTFAPHLSRGVRPGEIPKHDAGGAGLPVWRW